MGIGLLDTLLMVNQQMKFYGFMVTKTYKIKYTCEMSTRLPTILEYTGVTSFLKKFGHVFLLSLTVSLAKGTSPIN